MTEGLRAPSTFAAFCGDFCGKCPNLGGRCKGCVPEDHRACRFVQCCLSKGLEHCGLCSSFPCAELAAFAPDDRPGHEPGYHIQSLRERAALGTEAWLEGQRKKWAHMMK